MTLPLSDIRKQGIREIADFDALNKKYRMFSALSSRERRAFMVANAKKLAPYLGTSYEAKAAEALYNNRSFIDRFGLKAFNSMDDGTQNSLAIRNKLLQDDYNKQKAQIGTTRSTILNNTFKNVFGKDSDFEEKNNGLDDQGKLDLLKNSSYLSSSDLNNTIAKHSKEGLEAQKKEKDKGFWRAFNFSGANSANNQYELFNQANKIDGKKDREKLEDKNKSILEKLYNQTQTRREAGVSGLTTANYNKMMQASAEGKTSLKQLRDTFDKMATKASPYYAQFKDSKWLKDYSNEDMLKDYAKVMALSQKYGDGVALTYLDRSMQNRVAKAQDWKVTGNTLKGVSTTTVSDLGGQVAMMRALQACTKVVNGVPQLDMKALGLYNQGLIPKYDKNGKIIGSEKNADIWTNPAYWNDMYMYNTYSPTEIELIKQRSGVSKDINVREYGWNPNEHFISWDTVYEGIKQGGHVIAAMLESGTGGVVGKTVGLVGKGAGMVSMRAAGALNASGKVLNGMQKVGAGISKVGAKTHNIVMKGLASLNGPQGEAMGTFNEQLENNREAIKDQVRKELKQYYNKIDFNSKEAQSAINSIYKNLKAEDQKRVKISSGEGSRALPMSDKTLMQQAKQVYTNNLLESEEKRLTQKHDLEASTNAAKTYATNWIMDFGKEALITHGVKKFKVAKGALMGEVDNSPIKNFMADVKTGGVKRAVNNAGKEIKNLSARNMAKAGAKQVVSGFADEYLDGINANFSEAAGSNAFKQYINNQFDPNAYHDTVEGVLGNLIEGMNGAIDGVTNRENLYEGFIGAITPFTSFMPNVGSVFTAHDTWNAVVKGKDSNGKPINITERTSYLINNPLLYEYANLKNKDRALDHNIEIINNVVKAYKENGTIDDAAKAMSAVNDYSSGYSNTDENNPVSSVMTAEDNKLFNAFNLMSVAKTLEKINGGTKSALYGQTMDRLKGLAEGSLSDKEMEEEVNQFLSDPDNKSILNNNTPEQARVIAEGRLKKNAQFFMDLYKKKDEIDAKLDNSPRLKNIDSRVRTSLEYQLLAKDNWKERLKTLEEETGVSYTNADQDYTPNLEMIYGSHTSRKTALNARIRETEKLANAQLQINKENAQSERTIESLQEQLDVAKTEEEKDKIQEKIDQETALIKSRKLRSKQLSVQNDAIREEVKTLRTLIADTTGKPLLENSTNFTVDMILNSDARTRAEILNDANRKRYTKKQLAIIDKAKAKLEQQDPNALQKIQDAGELAHRVEDSNRIYDTLLNNSDVAVAYFDAQEEFRNRKAIAESLQREIDTHYKELDKVLEAENPDDLDIRNTVSTWSSTLINSYMEDHPNSVTKLKAYYDLAKFDEDAASIIMNGKEDDGIKESKFRTLMILQSISKDREELVKRIEDAIDDESINPDERNFFNNLLDTMQTLGYQRDATVVETREKKKKREAEEKAKRDKEEAGREAKRKEEEARKAAETKKNTEGSNGVDEEPLMPYEDNTEEPLVLDDSKPEEPLVPDNTTTEKPDISANGEGATEVKTEIVDLGEQSFINSVMSDDMEDGDVDAGEIWNGTSEGPRKGTLIINKKDNKLTFSANGNNVALTISPNDYKSEASKENKAFKATSLEKKDDGWYFNGNFDGSKEQTQVKASDNFNLEKVIEEQKKANERLYIKQGGDTSSQRVITDAEGNTTVRSETIEEQAKQLSEEEQKQVTTVNDNTSDTPTLNTVGERINDTSPVMSGNGMSEWKMGDKGDNLLDEYGILEHKKGAQEGDHMNQFFAWTEEQGWHIQNIIDRELGQILLANPKAKFKFMSVTDNDLPSNTKDARVFEDWFLVLDYDENINNGITTLHDEDNGGVITVDGKRYLVVGTVYQRSGNNEATSRNLLFNTSKSNSGVKAEKKRFFGEESSNAQDGYGVIFTERGEYIKQHPQERFFVSEKYSTEVVPNSLIPGYMVKRQENDTEEEHRSLEELLNDKERNPFGYTLKTIPIAIQMLGDFYVNNPVGMSNIMYPRDPYGNMGAAFILFPAGNGKFFCAHVDPVMYRDMKESSLKDQATQAINKLCSVDYKTRIEGIKELSNIFYFDPRKDQNGNFVLTNEKRNTVTFVNKGRKEMPIKITKELDPQVIFNAFEEMNPRVNITMFNIKTEKSIKELSDAGILNINLAQLALAGSSYSVYGVNLDGTLDKPSESSSPEITTTPFNKNKTMIVFDVTGKGDVEQFVYNKDTGKYTQDGDILSEEEDAELIKQLEYNRKKLEGGISFLVRVYSDEYYIADEQGPLVVKINENTHHATELSPEESREIIDKYRRVKEDKAREKVADNILNEEGSTEEKKEPQREDYESEEDYYAAMRDYNEEADRQALMDLFPEPPTTQNEGQEKKEEKKEEKEITEEEAKAAYALRKERLLTEGVESISFQELFKTNSKFRNNLISIGKAKWADFPKKAGQIEQFLRDKKIDVDNIPNDEEAGISALLDTIKHCR